MKQDNNKTHAILDAQSRHYKARKIELIVSRFGKLQFGKFLEIGCGSGYIAAYFSNLGFGDKGTYAVDIADERQVHEGFQFSQVSDTRLPFDNEGFDLIISNHVIEHVGDTGEQINHLKEIHRLLKPEGILYLAVPNKWQLVEPHYRLPFLSWLNEKASALYLNLLGKGKEYDCFPLSRQSCEQLLADNGFTFESATIEAITLVAEIESNYFAKIISLLPRPFIKLFMPIIPTLIYVCKLKQSSSL